MSVNYTASGALTRTILTTKTGSASAGGTLTLWTPASGKRIRLYGFIVATSQTTASIFQVREITTDLFVSILKDDTPLSLNFQGDYIEFAVDARLDIVNNGAGTQFATAWGVEA